MVTVATQASGASAFYAASGETNEDSLLPSGAFTGTPEEALDCACGTYFGDPSAWVTN